MNLRVAVASKGANKGGQENQGGLGEVVLANARAVRMLVRITIPLRFLIKSIRGKAVDSRDDCNGKVVSEKILTWGSSGKIN